MECVILIVWRWEGHLKVNKQMAAREGAEQLPAVVVGRLLHAVNGLNAPGVRVGCMPPVGLVGHQLLA